VTGVDVVAPSADAARRVLTPDALAFVAELQREFNGRRADLLGAREERQAQLIAGEMPNFLAETSAIRDDRTWHVAASPSDLQDRRVEITGPAEPKTTINALNSGARVFMADLEDALSPTWSNVLTAQSALRDAVRGELSFTSPEGKSYSVGEAPATLVVRPRGWHLEEHHIRVDGTPISASLFDFGLYLFHNGRESLDRGMAPALGPYFYLPKLESHLEARLWNDVFVFAQDRLGIARGSIRATVLVETILAAFEMDEILYELREHAAGLNAGRWDYIFSVIKRFRTRPEMVLPDRSAVTMAVPFTQLLVRTCHRRGAHAIGGMSAFIPNRRDPEVTEHALARVREDKEREVGDGFDGTWVAHPDLVPVARAVFDRALGDRPHQKDRLRDDVDVSARELLDTRIDGAGVTEAGVRANVSVALQYLDAWLRGTGAAAINDLMEDAATAEISRGQLWHWSRHGVRTDDGDAMTTERYGQFREEELRALGGRSQGRLDDAAAVLDSLVLADDFPEFLTLGAYGMLEG
jgi:malate synthase